MNKKRSEWANEEGSALVLTLMIFLVLTVLATSISFLTVGSFRLSDINRDGTSAFYIAEAGAKKAYEKASQEVMKTYEATTTTTSSNFYAALDALFLKKERPFSFAKQLRDDAKANVTFTATDSNPRKYTLTSTGSVGGKTRTVQKQFDVSWVDKGGSGGFPALPENAALVTRGNTEIIGNELKGDIYTTIGEKPPRHGVKEQLTFSWGAFNDNVYYLSSKITKEQLTNNVNKPKGFIDMGTPINWKGYEDLINDYVVPTVKTVITETLQDKVFYAYGGKEHYLIKNGNINFHRGFPTQDDSGRNLSSYTLDVNKNLEFKDINVEAGKTLVINPNGGNRVILVDNLSVTSGNIDIVGEGKVTLVVDKNINFNHTLRINNEENKNKLLFVYTGKNAKFKYISKLYGNIIVKNENADVEINDSFIDGVFVTDSKKVNLKTNGTSNMLLIAPFAHVEMGSYHIKGSIIANSFKLNGNGGTLEYAKIDTSGFPVGSGGPSTTPTLEDLLKSGPILEQ